MAIISIKSIGYSITGDLLDLKIAIPYTEDDSIIIRSFKVAKREQIREDGQIDSSANDYIKFAAYAMGLYDMTYGSLKSAFNKIFKYTKETEQDAKGNVYKIYELDTEFEWNPNPSTTLRYKGIHVNHNDFYVMRLESNAPSAKEYIYANDCNEDTGVLMYPIYHQLSLKLDALSHAKFLECSCVIPYETIHKLLQMELFETACCTNNWYEAVTYWNNFYNKRKFKKSFNKCNCHGK